MSEPFRVSDFPQNNLAAAIQEVISGISALNMEPRPLTNPEGKFLSETDYWVDHSLEHFHRAIEMMGKCQPEDATEIKPVGWDRSLAETSLRKAYVEVIEPLYDLVRNMTFGSGKKSAEHLTWMCDQLLSNMKDAPTDKIGRWVGYIQGVMSAHGCLDVDEERNRTRPIFTKVYNEQKLLKMNMAKWGGTGELPSMGDTLQHSDNYEVSYCSLGWSLRKIDSEVALLISEQEATGVINAIKKQRETDEKERYTG